MTIAFLIGAIVLGVAVLIVIIAFGKKRPYALHKHYFEQKWSELLSQVKTPEGMVLAVIDADKLLEEALRKRRYKGKTTGERLVAAQRILTDNDAVWYAHKLRNRLVHDPDVQLKKRDAQTALSAFRQSLKDLGAL